MQVHDQVRGLTPWPGANGKLGEKSFKIWKTKRMNQTTTKVPGTILDSGDDGILLACGEGTVLCILELQAEGKRRMSAADFLRGNTL